MHICGTGRKWSYQRKCKVGDSQSFPERNRKYKTQNFWLSLGGGNDDCDPERKWWTRGSYHSTLWRTPMRQSSTWILLNGRRSNLPETGKWDGFLIITQVRNIHLRWRWSVAAVKGITPDSFEYQWDQQKASDLGLYRKESWKVQTVWFEEYLRSETHGSQCGGAWHPGIWWEYLLW